MGNNLPFSTTKTTSTPKQPKVNLFDQIDERRAPNVKQYLRGLRNYYVLSKEIKVRIRDW